MKIVGYKMNNEFYELYKQVIFLPLMKHFSFDLHVYFSLEVTKNVIVLWLKYG